MPYGLWRESRLLGMGTSQSFQFIDISELGAPFIAANWDDFPSAERLLASFPAVLARFIGLIRGRKCGCDGSVHPCVSFIFLWRAALLGYSRIWSPVGALVFGFCPLRVRPRTSSLHPRLFLACAAWPGGMPVGCDRGGDQYARTAAKLALPLLSSREFKTSITRICSPSSYCSAAWFSGGATGGAHRCLRRRSSAWLLQGFS